MDISDLNLTVTMAEAITGIVAYEKAPEAYHNSTLRALVKRDLLTRHTEQGRSWYSITKLADELFGEQDPALTTEEAVAALSDEPCDQDDYSPEAMRRKHPHSIDDPTQWMPPNGTFDIRSLASMSPVRPRTRERANARPLCVVQVERMAAREGRRPLEVISRLSGYLPNEIVETLVTYLVKPEPRNGVL